MTVREIYDGSDGAATQALYAQLVAFGPVGEIAMNLFRAQKASARAKVYRGGIRGVGSYRRMAYDKKNWSLQNLTRALAQHAPGLNIQWGWQQDRSTPGYMWVLYIDIPTGQVSFHAPSRGAGPDYPARWDGLRGASHHRVIEWCEQLVVGVEAHA